MVNKDPMKSQEMDLQLFSDLLTPTDNHLTSQNSMDYFSLSLSLKQPMDNAVSPMEGSPMDLQGQSTSELPLDSPPNQGTSKPKHTTRKPKDEHQLADKRARNTEAARRSRQRKLETLHNLEGKVQVLEQEQNQLRVQVAVLENEKHVWVNREQELASRIKVLESQLGEAHRSLIEYSKQ